MTKTSAKLSGQAASRGKHALIAAAGILALPVLVAAAVVVLVLWVPVLIVMHLVVWSTWLPRGRMGILVYSNSPNWQQDVEETILPVVRGRLVVLNWSQRKRWPNKLAVWCFRVVNFGRRTNWNPIAIVFRPLHPLKTVRLFHAYRDAKHGKLEELESKKKELFELIR